MCVIVLVAKMTVCMSLLWLDTRRCFALTRLKTKSGARLVNTRATSCRWNIAFRCLQQSIESTFVTITYG